MRATTKRWGIGGAVVLPLLGGLLALSQDCLPYGSLLRDVVHRVVQVLCYPVALFWQAIFSMFGAHGEQGMGFILPVYASILLNMAALGFGIGALLSRLTKRHDHADKH